jgi:hypothetical protein
MKQLLIIGLLLTNFISLFAADTLVYTKVSVVINTKNISYDGFKSNKSYKINNLTFAVGSANNNEINFRVYNDSNLLLFTSPAQADIFYLELYFYKNNENKLVVVAEAGTEYSWGGVAYYATDSAIGEMGALDIAMPEEQNIARINDNIKITETAGIIYTSVIKTKEIVLHPGSDNESVVKADLIKFIWNKKTGVWKLKISD